MRVIRSGFDAWDGYFMMSELRGREGVGSVMFASTIVCWVKFRTAVMN